MCVCVCVCVCVCIISELGGSGMIILVGLFSLYVRSLLWSMRSKSRLLKELKDSVTVL